jgi:hypothetical protein
MDAKDPVNERLADLENQLKQVNQDNQKLAAAIEAKDLTALSKDLQIRSEFAKMREKEVKRQLGVAGSLRTNGHAKSKLLEIPARLTHPDGLSTKALLAVRAGSADSVKKALELVNRTGVGSALTRLSAHVNGSGTLDQTNRFLLSDPEIYAGALLPLLETAEAKGTLDKFVADKEGFRVALLGRLEDENGPRHLFVRTLVRESLKRMGVSVSADPKAPTANEKLLTNALLNNPVPLDEGRVEEAVEAAYEEIVRDGSYPALVEAFAATHEVDKNKFTPEIKKAMVSHLLARGVKIETEEQLKRFNEGAYDEYFALAYEKAVTTAVGSDDPIVVAATKGATIAPWDFTVDTFESIEEQGVVKENILAAGALDYIFELGERLGIFRLVDALTLNWAAGAIDVVDGPCASKLYRYWKLRDQRMDPAERGLVYKRVLNKGETEALDRMVVNESFEALWGTLAEKVAEYRAKVEDAKVEQGDHILVSRTPIYQALRDLQYNLTEFCTGMAHMQIREMYAQLREAMDLIGDPEIIDHFAGGRRKTMWTAIERLAKSEYGEAPNINAIRIAAVEGNAVFRFIANFQPGAFSEEEFQRFIEAAEAWIIAKGSDDSGLTALAGEEDEDASETEEDDFGDEEV